MDNQEKLATSGTQDINNGQSRETGNIGNTRHNMITSKTSKNTKQQVLNITIHKTQYIDKQITFSLPRSSPLKTVFDSVNEQKCLINCNNLYFLAPCVVPSTNDYGHIDTCPGNQILKCLLYVIFIVISIRVQVIRY